MSQVAHTAGVSPMTVSYFYSQPGRVSGETAARVGRAARRLGYPGPHPGARSLRRGRTGTLGVVLGEPLAYAFEDPQAARFLAGVSEVCAAERLGLTLVPIGGSAEDADRVAEAAVDGFVVWTTADDDPILDAVVATGLPCVVHAGPAGRGLPVVGIEADRAAAREIGAEAFAGAGRPAVLGFPMDLDRRAATLRGPDPATATFAVTRRRLEGLRDACAANGSGWAQVPVLVCPRNGAAEGEAAVEELLRSGELPDAIAAMSDELALGALRAAVRHGIAVPEVLAVTGWDDSEAAARAGLTTVSQSLEEQGALCARLALGGEATASSDASGGSSAAPRPAGDRPRDDPPSLSSALGASVLAAAGIATAGSSHRPSLAWVMRRATRTARPRSRARDRHAGPRHHRRRLRRAGRGAQLDPPGDGIWAAGDPPPREGCKLEILIDGAEALPRISAALDRARTEINIAGWHITPDFGLDRDEGARRLRDHLAELAERVDVRVLLWAGAPLPVFSPRPLAGARGPRRTDPGDEGPVRARLARAADALPPREAGDRRRRGRLRRRHRPDLARRRPLRLRRSSGPRQDRLARRLEPARGARGRRRRRPLRLALARGDGGEASPDLAAAPGRRPRGPGDPHRAGEDLRLPAAG